MSFQQASDDVEEDPKVKGAMPIGLDSKFKDYDTNKDGRLSYEEFKKALPPAPANQIRAMFDHMDKNSEKSRYIISFVIFKSV